MSIEIKISKKPISYKRAMVYLNRRVDQVKNGKKRELLWILEHPTTYTAGVSFNKKEILDNKVKVCFIVFPKPIPGSMIIFLSLILAISFSKKS